MCVYSPSNVLRIDVKPGEAADLFFCQVVWIGLVDPKSLQAPHHDRAERPDPLLGGAETIEQSFV